MCLNLNKWVGNLFIFVKLHGRSVRDSFWIQLAKIGFVSNRLLGRRRPIGVFLLRDATVRTYYGLFRCGKNDDDLDVVFEGFERDVLTIFKPKAGESVVDCGAHIGKYSVLASKLVGSAGQVVALEPTPRSYQRLMMNLKLNDCDNVTPLNYAAWNETTERTLWVNSRSSTNSLNPSLWAPSNIGSIKVKCLRLDEVMRTMNKIDWLKLDVEGADFEALEGASESIRKGKIRNIIIEASKQATLDRLAHEGYSLTRLPSGYYHAYYGD